MRSLVECIPLYENMWRWHVQSYTTNFWNQVTVHSFAVSHFTISRHLRFTTANLPHKPATREYIAINQPSASAIERTYPKKVSLFACRLCIPYASGSICVWVWTAKWQFSNKTVAKSPFNHFRKVSWLYPNLTNGNSATVCHWITIWPFRLKLKPKRNLRYFEHTFRQVSHSHWYSSIFIAFTSSNLFLPVFTGRRITGGGKYQRWRWYVQHNGYIDFVLTKTSTILFRQWLRTMRKQY